MEWERSNDECSLLLLLCYKTYIHHSLLPRKYYGNRYSAKKEIQRANIYKFERLQDYLKIANVDTDSVTLAPNHMGMFRACYLGYSDGASSRLSGGFVTSRIVVHARLWLGIGWMASKGSFVILIGSPRWGFQETTDD